MRPDKDEYYLSIARQVSERSTCLRRRYGAVIVQNDEIVATGYNGAPRGEENCCDRKRCWREEHRIPHGQRYELCRGVHAEQNAIISAGRARCQGATLYLAGSEYDLYTLQWVDMTYHETAPCEICEKLIKAAGIGKVVS